MKKGLSLLLALALAVLALPALAEGTVNVLSWEGYVDEDTIQAFENETGIDVVWSPMDSIDDMLLKVTQSGGEGYDLILTSDYSLDILRQAGLLQELDKSLLPNYENLNPLYLNQYFDPDNQYVIPYVAGCPLIVYDPERVSFEITGYEDLWNESLTDSVACLEQYRVLIGVTLKTLGYSMNETDPDILGAGERKADAPVQEHPHLRRYGGLCRHAERRGQRGLPVYALCQPDYAGVPPVQAGVPQGGTGLRHRRLCADRPRLRMRKTPMRS